MPTKIFISRELSEDSFFLSRCLEMKVDLTATSLIDFHPVPFSAIPETNWIFFYSKNAVRFFFLGLSSNYKKSLSSNARPQSLKESLPANELSFLSNTKLACIGNSTAGFAEQALSKIEGTQNLTIHFRGNGKPKSTASEFLKFAERQSVLFPRAKRSKKSVQKLLKGKIIAHDLIVYDNRPKKDFEIPDCGILVFTSPMNAKVYFSKYLPKPILRIAEEGDQTVIAIGKTTERALRKLGLENIIVAESASEEGLWEEVKKLIG